MTKVWIVIPAFNEGKKIFSVIEGLKNNGYSNIVVVDDFSSDNTVEVSIDTGVKVLKHKSNLGQGAALRSGINFSLKDGADIIVTFDSDGQHQPEDISRLIKPIIEDGYDIALGSRFLNKSSNVGFIRKLFLKGGALIFRIMYGVKLTDSHNGLRAFSKSAAKDIKITQNRMEHASEIIEEIGKLGLKYVEVPVTIIYSDYSVSKGQSTWNAFNILFKMIKKKVGRR